MKLKTFFLMLLCIAFSACQTGPVTQARIDAAPSVWNDTWETVDARKCNKEFGLKLGTPAFGECMLKLSASRSSNFQAINPLTQQLLQQGQWQTYDGKSLNAVPSTSGGGGYLRSQSVSGQMRYCSYDKMGATVIVTIARHEICPLTN